MKVSVLMPVYNGAQYLQESIDSILRQTFTDFEFIIVDDGSTDDSAAIIAKNAQKDCRIISLCNEKNSGICVTLNRGLDIAKGEYIARLDSDDMALPNRLEMQVAYMEQHPQVGALGSDVIFFGEDIKTHCFESLHSDAECKAGLLFSSCFAHPSVMLRKDILDKYELRYDDGFRGLEDFELWYRMSEYTEFANLPQALTKYRIHKRQVTQNVSKSVSDIGVSFLHDRFLSYALFTTEELCIIENYVFNNWSFFYNEHIQQMLDIFLKIMKNERVCQNQAFKRAMRVTLSKALSFACNNSSGVTLNSRTLYTSAFLKGLMPFDWYCKFMYHTFFKL